MSDIGEDGINDPRTTDLDRQCLEWLGIDPDDFGGWGGCIYDGDDRSAKSGHTVRLAPDVDRIRIMLREADSGDWRPASPDEVREVNTAGKGAVVDVQADCQFTQFHAAQAPDADLNDPGVFAIGGRPCHACNGTGEIDLTVGGAKRIVDCDECGGDGVVS